MRGHLGYQYPNSSLHLQAKGLSVWVTSDQGRMVVEVDGAPKDRISPSELRACVQRAVAGAAHFNNPAITTEAEDCTMKEGNPHYASAVVAQSLLPQMCALALATLNELADMKKLSSNGQSVDFLDRSIEIHYAEESCNRGSHPMIEQIMQDQLVYALKGGHITRDRAIMLDGLLGLPVAALEQATAAPHSPPSVEKT